MFNMDELGSSVDKDHGTAELIGLGFATGGVEEASRDPRFEMITKDAGSRDELVGDEVPDVVGRLRSSGGVIRAASLFAVLTGGAGWLVRKGLVIQPESGLVKETTDGEELDMRER